MKDDNSNKTSSAKKTKQQVTMNMNISTVGYFKAMASETGIPYQTLINMYLDECVREKKRLKFE